MTAPSRLPVVTVLLIAANIAAAFLLLVQPDLAYEFGFRPNLPRLHAAFTSLFLHANVLHLLGNMLFLAAVGAAVELSTGSLRFAAVYFLSGIAGVLAHFIIARADSDPVPLIGASGAIAGCAAYYSLRYMSLRIPVVPRLALPVLAITAIWVVLQVAGAFVRIGDTSGVAYWAHLGGFAAGILLSLVFRAPDVGQVRMAHEVLDRMGDRSPAALAVAAEQHLERHPNDEKALWDLAHAYEKLEEPAKEVPVLLRVIESGSPTQTDALRRLCHVGYVSRLSILQRLQLAHRHSAEDPVLAKALLRSVVDGPEDAQRPDAILSLAALEREADPDRSQELLAGLERDYPLHPAVDLARKRGWLS